MRQPIFYVIELLRAPTLLQIIAACMELVSVFRAQVAVKPVALGRLWLIDPGRMNAPCLQGS